LFEDGNVGVGVLPESEKILIGFAGAGGLFKERAAKESMRDVASEKRRRASYRELAVGQFEF